MFTKFCFTKFPLEFYIYLNSKFLKRTMTNMAEKAILKIGDKDYDLPIMEGSEKEKAIDITKLRAQTGYVTIDSGYLNTGACTSAITFLDGELGILRYRGIPIEQLAEKSTFTEVAHLLKIGRAHV